MAFLINYFAITATVKNNCKIDFLSSACEKVARTPTFPTQNMAYELCLTRDNSQL